MHARNSQPPPLIPTIGRRACIRMRLPHASQQARASSRALIHGFKDLIIYKYALVCVHVSLCVCVLLAASSGNTCAVRCNCVNTRRPNARARERHPSPTTRRTRFVNARMFTLSPNVRACVRACAWGLVCGHCRLAHGQPCGRKVGAVHIRDAHIPRHAL